MHIQHKDFRQKQISLFHPKNIQKMYFHKTKARQKKRILRNAFIVKQKEKRKKTFTWEDSETNLRKSSNNKSNRKENKKQQPKTASHKNEHLETLLYFCCVFLPWQCFFYISLYVSAHVPAFYSYVILHFWGQMFHYKFFKWKN